MSWVIDGNVLIALAIDGHPQHLRARLWFEGLTERFHTCSVTEGTFLRMHMQMAADHSAGLAWKTLHDIQAAPLHVFLDDGFTYQQVSRQGLLGHKQVTDAWLAQLARRHGARLATFDTGLVAAHPDVSVSIP